MDKQYRTLANCNMRQEPSNPKAAIAATVQAGAIVHVDDTQHGRLVSRPGRQRLDQRRVIGANRMTYAATFARLRQLSKSPADLRQTAAQWTGTPNGTRSTTIMTRSRRRRQSVDAHQRSRFERKRLCHRPVFEWCGRC